MLRPLTRCLLLAVFLVPAACSSGPGTLSADVDFKGPDGKVLYQLEADDRGFEVTDAAKKELVDYRWVESALRIRVGENVLGFVRADSGGLVVTDAAGQESLRFTREGAEDWVLGSVGRVVGKLDLRSDGYKVTDAAGAEVARVKADADDVSVRTPANELVVKTKLRLPVLAVACMSFGSLPLEQRLGLVVGVVGFKLGQ